MTKFKTQTRWIAIASAAVAVVLLSGCAITQSNDRRLQLWKVGENLDFVLVRSVRPLNPTEIDPSCKEGKISPLLKGMVDDETRFVSFLKENVCPDITEWRVIGGFTKSDFGKGSIGAAGLVRSEKNVEVDDIVETKNFIGVNGHIKQAPLVTRIIRKNALKERDPTCYWDGQSGRFDSFATGGVVCPAEGWDWRDQKWSNK
jgi:hypothetical protein